MIDRLVRARDGALEIHDYKTGRRVPTQAELDRDRQLALYEIGARRRSGRKARCASSGTTSTRTRCAPRSARRSSSPRCARRPGASIDRIRAEKAWEPREGPLCRWCEYQSVCPVFAGAAAAAAAEPPAPGLEPDEGELGQLSLW